MINTVPLYLTILLTILTAVIGYLVACMLMSTKVSQANSANQLLQNELLMFEKINLDNESLRIEKHKLDIENNTLQSKSNSLSEQRERFESQLKFAQESREQAQKAQHTAEQDKRALQTEISETEKTKNALKETIAELKAELTDAREKLDIERQSHSDLRTRFAELNNSLEERQKGFDQQIKQFEQQKQALSEQFKLLANEILEAKTKSLTETNKQSLTNVMNPFQETLKNFKDEVQKIHHMETTQQGELKKELEHLKELNKSISEEAHQLTTALRGQKKIQGNWGELVLENVLDRSGLELGKDFKREVSFNTEEGKQRPDAIVYLPQNKHLIIDAKVSLEAYTQYVNAEDDIIRAQALNAHVKAMRDRINELADRNYYKIPGLNSPEMVFMFVPIESAFVEALKADETLFQKAIENNVLVATPTTLLTSLNIVRQLWRYEDQNKHTAALANQAEKVFTKLNTFLGSFEALKRGLDRANEAYTKAEGQLVSGKGNLVKQVGEFKNLAPAIKAQLPSYFTDKADLEINYIPEELQLSDNPVTHDIESSEKETV